MPSTRLIWLSACATAAMALAGCSYADESEPTASVSSNEEFVRLLEDARFEANRGDLATAGRLLDAAREREPNNPQLWVDIARLRFRGGEHLSAIEAADFAMQLGPNYGPALLMRAQLVRDAHGLYEALPWFEAAAAADPANPDVLAEYAATLGDLGRSRDMLTVVREIAEFAPRHPKVHFLQSVLAARANDPVIARSLLERSGLRNSGVPAAILLDALIHMQQSNYDSAASSFEDLADRQPGNVRVVELLARAYWLSGRDDEIVERFGPRVEGDDVSPYLMMLVGRALERRGDRVQAAELIERARNVPTGELAVLTSVGAERDGLPAPTNDLRSLISTDRLSTARSVSRSLIARLPQSADIRTLSGDTMLAAGEHGQALEQYNIAAAVRRPWPLTRKIIEAYRVNEDTDAADVLLIRHLRGEPYNTEAMLMLAERSAKDEDWLRVAVLLDFAIELGAGNDPKLVELRAKAADELDQTDDAAIFMRALGNLKPRSFVGE